MPALTDKTKLRSNDEFLMRKELQNHFAKTDLFASF